MLEQDGTTASIFEQPSMHIIAKPVLRQFWQLHEEARAPLERWHTVLSHTQAKDFSSLKKIFNSVDWVQGYVVFDIGGNKFRVICDVVFRTQTVFIKHVFTHREYDSWLPSHPKH